MPRTPELTSGPVPKAQAGWYAVAVLCVTLIVSFADRLVINLVVDPIRADLGLTDFEISLLQGAGFAVLFAFAGLPSGRLADSFSRKSLIACGVALWSAATILCGLALEFWSFFAARLAVGLGEAVLVPAASSLIIDCFAPHRRGTALGIFSLGATFGTGIALFGGGLVLAWIQAGALGGVPWIDGLSPWRQLMILAGLPGFALLPLLLAIAEPARHHRAHMFALSAVLDRLLADNGAVLRVCLVKGAAGIGDYALIAWLPTLLQRAYGLTPLEAGGLVAVSITLSGLTASLAAGALADWIAVRWDIGSRVALLLGSYALAACGALTFMFAATAESLALAFALWAFGSIGGYVVGHVVMQESMPGEMRATTIALSLAATALVGMGLGPTLVPLVAALGPGGEGALQGAIGAVSLCAALLALAIIWSPARKALAALGKRKS